MRAYARITMQMKRKDAARAPNTDSRGQRLPVWHEDEALLVSLESLGRPHHYVASSRQEVQATKGIAGANST